MAKQQTFGDKAKAKAKSSSVTVKFIKTVKTDSGSYKFQERFVRLQDINELTTLK